MGRARRADFREVILSTMADRSVGRMDLARRMAELQICNQETVLRYLRGDQDTTGTIISAMLAELGLVVGPHNEAAPGS